MKYSMIKQQIQENVYRNVLFKLIYESATKVEEKDPIISAPGKGANTKTDFLYDIPTSITINKIASDRGIQYGVAVPSNRELYFDVIMQNKSSGKTQWKVVKYENVFYALDRMDAPKYQAKDIHNLLSFLEKVDNDKSGEI
jgi:hypothetical protein